MLVALGTTAIQAGAQPPGHRAGPHGFGGAPDAMVRQVERLLDGLGTTSTQRGEIDRIIAAAGADLRVDRDAERRLRARGLQILTAPTVDARAAEALRQEITAQQDHASRRTLDAMLQIANVLTPEQRAKMAARVQDRQAVMQDRRQRMEQDRTAPRQP